MQEIVDKDNFCIRCSKDISGSAKEFHTCIRCQARLVADYVTKINAEYRLNENRNNHKNR